MSTDTSSDRVYASFLSEAPELLQQIERDLLSLREECSLNKVHNLMRATHTLKGAAASVGLETLKQVAHSLESVFKALYNPAVAIDAQIEALLFQSYECLRLPVAAVLTRATWNESEVLDRAAAVFDRLHEKLGSSGEGVPLPMAAELGVDITHSIFEQDVSDRLTVLADAIDRAEPVQVAEILQQQAAVFLGLAEALELPSFGAIAQTALASLNAFPDRAVTIAQLALSDWQQVRSAVLAGSEGKRDGGVGGENNCQPPLYGVAPAFTLNQQPATSQNSLVHSAPIVKVDWQQLERLKDLNTNLVAYQNQQAAIDRQTQATLQKLQQQLQQHQQTLDRLWTWSQKLMAQPDRQQTFSVSKTEIVARNFVTRLFQSLWAETMQLRVATGEVATFHRERSQISAQVQQLVTQMHSDLTRASTSSLGEVFLRLQRVLEQLASVHCKPIELELSGTEILVDSAIVDRLYEILLHLARNAFDHGIESPAIRHQLGKPQTGQIRLEARQQGQWTIIDVSDDGRGLDWEKIIERAQAMNLLAWEQVTSLSPAELSNVLFIPGFSTATQVSDLSGRGVGLDVVRAHLELLQGEIALRSEPDRGTTFTLRLPRHFNCFSSEDSANSALLKAVCASAIATEPVQWQLKTSPLFVWLTKIAVFMLPYANIAECVVPQLGQVEQIQQQRFLNWRGQKIPLYALAQILEYKSPAHSSLNLAVDDAALTLVIHHENQVLAIESAMQRLVTTAEIAIAPCDRSIAFPSYIYGCTVWERRLLLVIDVMSLLARQATEDE